VNWKLYQEEEAEIVTIMVTAVAVTVSKGPVLDTVALHLAEGLLCHLI
jgi:hypothetical protein